MLLLIVAVAVTGCESSERSGGGKTTATPPISQQSAFDVARHYLDTEAVSKRGLLQRMGGGVGESYSKAEATYAVNHVGADWKAEAVERAKNRESPLSPKRLMEYLTEDDWFSKAEATYAVSHAGRDWNAEAVMAAKSVLDAEALSKSQLIKELALQGYTDAQVRYAVEKVY